MRWELTRFHSFNETRGYDVFMELIFEVREAEEGGYVARALGQAIFTEAETWQELRDNVREVTSLHFEDAAIKPRLIQLHFVKDELIAIEAA
jgi:predicted RNase H-like HicB family nuclease